MNNSKKEQETSNELQEHAKKAEKERETKITNAELYVNCRCHAAIALTKMHGNLDVGTVFQELTKSIDRVIDGKTTEIEAMFITQAKVLEYVCYDALSKLHTAEMQYAEIYANVALRAQNQARKTLIALADLKNPRRTTFIKQQNNQLNQQINNNEKPEFKNSGKVANKVESEVKLEKMDSGRTLETITINPATETVDALDRA